MKHLVTISNTVGTGLTTTAVITGSVSIPAFTGGWSYIRGFIGHYYTTTTGERWFSKIKPIIHCKARNTQFNYVFSPNKH